jgi:hypothetical protein
MAGRQHATVHSRGMLQEFLMITNAKPRIFGALVALACLLSAAPAVAESVKIGYAGSGFDTTVDNGDDGLLVNLSLMQAKGSFGARLLDVSAEFIDADVDCPVETAREMGIFYIATVATFADNSQLLGVSQSGWMCLMDSGFYHGGADGVYIGGTGKFSGATGSWSTTFEGYNLEDPTQMKTIGFRSISGEVKGTVEIP